MGQAGKSFLAAALFLAWAPLPAQGQEQGQEQERPSVQEYLASMGRAFGEARGLAGGGGQRQAMAMFDEFLQSEPPEGDFDSPDPDAVGASYRLYSTLARMNWEAAMLADSIGQWEKAAAYFAKAGEMIKGPAERVRAAYPKFTEGYESGKARILMDMEAHADEISALRAKSLGDYTNDDYTALDQVQTWERGVEEADRAVGYYASRIEAADRDVAFYNPEQPYAEVTAEKIRLIQDQINKYKGGRGDKAKWVEGVISDYQKQLPSYATTQEEKIAFAYRLTVLSPNSRTAPVLLEWLRGNATEAELRRAIAASRPAPKK
jgi:hypothetical protein